MNRKSLFLTKISAPVAGALTIFVTLLISGCTSTGGTSSGVSAGAAFDSIREGVAMSTKKPPRSIILAKGMTKSEVVALMGDPAEIEHVFRNGAVGEIWTYKRTIYEGTKSDVIGERTTASTDPISGAVSVSTGVVSQIEELSSLATTELLFDEDTLVAFKEEVEKGIVRVVNR